MIYSDTEVEEFLRTGEKEAELRREFGNAEYDELTSLARGMNRDPGLLEKHRGEVFFLPGIMGSRLSVVENGVQDLVWVDPIDIIAGGLRKLKVGGVTIAATGIILSPYIKMKMRLKRAGYNVRFMAYDWRLPPAASGEALLNWVRRKNLRNVTLVCHSMGGLVAREMAAQDVDKSLISQVITIGTPNFGSYSPVEILALTHSMLRNVAMADLRHTPREISHDILRHFPGLLQMLPAPSMRPDEPFFETTGWPQGTVKPTKAALQSARRAQSALPLPDERFVQIVGWAEKTIINARKGKTGFVFVKARAGDGTVPRALAEVEGVRRYYTRGLHGDLCKRDDVIGATLELMTTGATSKLPRTLPMSRMESRVIEEVASEELTVPDEAEINMAKITDTTFAGEFLSGKAQRAKQPPPDVHVFDERNKLQYSKNLMDQARRRWDESARERQEVEQKLKEENPLGAETQERLQAYTRRLKVHVESLGNGRGEDIAQNLGRALGLAEEMDSPDKRLRRRGRAFLERVIGEAEEFLSVMFLKRAVIASRAVGRIISNHSHNGFGTGFLVAPGVLMTNNHVLASAAEASTASCQFSYELDADSRQSDGHIFRFVPDRLFYTDEDLDMSIVAVETFSLDGMSLDKFGYLPLVSAEGKIRKGQPVNIIQHPNGGRKQVVFRNSTLSALPEQADHVAHYSGDTQPGSSGSPVFSDRWEVVALHHAGVPDTNSDGDYLTREGTVWDSAADSEGRTLKWVANEGIRVSRIVRHLNDLPQAMETNDTPGADLVHELLRISKEASTGSVGKFFGV